MAKKVVVKKETAVKKEKEAVPAKKAEKKAEKKIEKKAVAAARRRVTFTVNASVGAKVFLAGSFNDWSAEECPMKDKDGKGVFSCMKVLAPGRYEYKFVVDGIWDIDAANPHFVSNDMGTLNSVLEVK